MAWPLRLQRCARHGAGDRRLHRRHDRSLCPGRTAAPGQQRRRGVMNLFSYFQGEVASVLRSLQSAGKISGDVDLTKVTVELPRDPSHGDLSTNAAMVLAKPLGLKPRDLAEMI